MANILNILELPKIKTYRPRVVTPDYDEDYRRLYRFSRAGVQYIVNYFLEETFENRGGALSAIQKWKLPFAI